MMRSLFSGVSGLRVHQTKMDVIANNISNVNTVGFKPSRVTFNEIFSQTISGAAGANASTGRGGVNPMQIGLGVNVASIDMIMDPGAAQVTGWAYDVMIDGDGFFVVGDNSGTYFTRAGAFRLDEFGNLTNPQGLKVMGWKATESTTTPGSYDIARTAARGITITGTDKFSPPQSTSLISFNDNINVSDSPIESSISFFDSIGNSWQMKARFVYDRTAKNWGIELGTQMIPNNDKTRAVYLSVSDPGTITSGASALAIATTGTKPAADYVLLKDVQLNFSTAGYLVTTDAAGTVIGKALSSLGVTITDANQLNPKSTFASPLRIDFSSLTQFESPTDATATAEDGYTAGSLNGVSIGPDGIVTGSYSNGKTKPLWQLVLAQFVNPAGLQKVGNNLFAATNNSGTFDGVGVAPTALLPGTLEMSKVDIAQEFTEMITTQRGFQANSRIITTSDEMITELVNMKR